MCGFANVSNDVRTQCASVNRQPEDDVYMLAEISVLEFALKTRVFRVILAKLVRFTLEYVKYLFLSWFVFVSLTRGLCVFDVILILQDLISHLEDDSKPCVVIENIKMNN